MGKPQNKITRPEGRSQTMYYTEGNPLAALVTISGRRENITHPRHATAESALAWCRTNRATLVYLPSYVGGN